MTSEQINKAKKMIFMEHWLEENFELNEFDVSSPRDFAFLLKDHAGDELVVELVDKTIYAGGKPVAGIPSLSF